MAAPPQIDVMAVKIFDRAVAFTAQRMFSALRNRCTQATLAGETLLMPDYGQANMRERLSRGEESIPQQLPRRRRAIEPRFFEYVEPFDMQTDEIRIQRDIMADSEFFMAIMAAVEREQDDVIVEAFDAPAFSGKLGTTSTVFDTAQDVSTGGAGNPLLLKQVRQAHRVLRGADVDKRQELTLAIHSDGIDQLLATVHIASADFNRMQALRDGEIDFFVGATWVETNAIAQETSTKKFAFMFSRAAMVFGQGPTVTKWHELGNRGLTWNYGAYATMAATRRFENQIVRIDYDHAEIPAQQDYIT